MDEFYEKHDYPCVMMLTGERSEKIYGPFESTKQAIEWANHQYQNGYVNAFAIIPLRTPFRERNNEDWWAGDYHQITIIDKEIPTNAWFKVKGWKRWRRNSNKILV